MFYSKVAEERAKLKFEDTNMALFGSEIEEKVKKASAEKESAWEGLRDKLGLFIWRIEKFQVKEWDKKKYSNFYDGDSYIILFNSKLSDGTIKHDAYIWIGQYSSQDEYGTAAYKVVELDNYLDRKATLYREVQANESKYFMGLFNNKVTYLSGGIESGFVHVEKITDFPPKLYHVRRNDDIYRVNEVPVRLESINNGDCFVLDKVNEIYSFIGDKASHFEKFKTAAFVKEITNADPRNTMKTDIHEIQGLSNPNEEPAKTFWDLLGGFKDNIPDKEIQENGSFEVKLLNCNDDSGEIIISEVAKGKLDKSLLKNDDVYLIDTKECLIVWVGSKSSKNEKREAFKTAANYLAISGRPSTLSIRVVLEGNEGDEFNKAFA